MFFCLVPVHFRVKDSLPRHRMVQLWVKIGKNRAFDNLFFGELQASMMLTMNNLHIQPVFLPIPGQKWDRVGTFGGTD
jgi:hypothetical protein